MGLLAWFRGCPSCGTTVLSEGIRFAPLPGGSDEPVTDTGLDPGIRRAVLALRSGGVETFESCEGGPGHAFPDPTVKFHGGPAAGYHAFAVAMDRGLPVLRVQRVHGVEGAMLDGPWWEIVFRATVRDVTD